MKNKFLLTILICLNTVKKITAADGQNWKLSRHFRAPAPLVSNEQRKNKRHGDDLLRSSKLFAEDQTLRSRGTKRGGDEIEYNKDEQRKLEQSFAMDPRDHDILSEATNFAILLGTHINLLLYKNASGQQITDDTTFSMLDIHFENIKKIHTQYPDHQRTNDTLKSLSTLHAIGFNFLHFHH